MRNGPVTNQSTVPLPVAAQYTVSSSYVENKQNLNSFEIKLLREFFHAESSGIVSIYLYMLYHYMIINPAKKETPHSFKGQQLEHKSLYRFVIYMSILEKFPSYNLTLSL